MSPEEFLKVAKYASDSMLLVDASGIILAVNPSAASEFNMLIEGSTGSLASLVEQPEEAVMTFLRSCSRTRAYFPSKFTVRSDKHGERDYIFEGALVKPRDHDSAAVLLLRCRPKNSTQKSFVALNQKINELTNEIMRRKKLEEERSRLLDAERRARSEVERASRAKDEFLAAISHELRTPMTAIMGWLQLLVDGEIEPDGYEEVFQILHRNAQLEVNLINDILDVSRIITGKLKITSQPVSIASIIDRAIEAVKLAAEAKQIEIFVSAKSEVGQVAGDVERLQQAVWNLLINAVKFSAKGGKIFVSVKRVNSKVEIKVTDEGEGIDQDFLPYVFERFLQEDGSKTRNHGGLGLGLSIVRHIVELHGGRVTVESGGKGKGASFTIALPLLAINIGTKLAENAQQRNLLEDLPTSLREGSDSPTKGHLEEILKGVRVIVVDDDLDARNFIAWVLRRHGAEVITAATAREALESLQQLSADVLLSDIGMPSESGYDLIRNVRLLDPNSGGCVPAAALTAFSSHEDRKQVLSSGFQKHMVKPVDQQELIQVVRELAKSRTSS